jgi:hypothetical protein
MNNIYFVSYLFFQVSFLSISPTVFSQISVTGSSCAVGGGTNGVLYSISGDVQNSDNITWTVTGGYFAKDSSTSYSGPVGSLGTQIRVVWKSGAKTGNLQLSHSRLGSASYKVTVVTISNTISTGSQTANFGSPLKISGGGPDVLCQPVFTYWWEMADSTNGPFIAINNAFGQHLTIDSVKKKSYYRRVVSTNGENFYSNVLLIDINQVSIGLGLLKGAQPALSLNPWTLQQIPSNLNNGYAWYFKNDISFMPFRKLKLNLSLPRIVGSSHNS